MRMRDVVTQRWLWPAESANHLSQRPLVMTRVHGGQTDSVAHVQRSEIRMRETTSIRCGSRANGFLHGTHASV